jgi:hypothetical protein
VAGREPARLATGALMRHLGWPTRTGRHRGPEQREPQSRVPVGTPSATVLIKKLRPIRQDHQQRGMARQNATSLARGHSRPRAPEQPSSGHRGADAGARPGPELSGARPGRRYAGSRSRTGSSRPPARSSREAAECVQPPSGYSQAFRANNDLSGRAASRTFLAANPRNQAALRARPTAPANMHLCPSGRAREPPGSYKYSPRLVEPTPGSAASCTFARARRARSLQHSWHHGR